MTARESPPRAPSRKIAAELAGAIAGGSYPPGSRLPSIPALAAGHGVNGKTAAKALHRLAEAGLAEMYPGLGYFARGTAEPSPAGGEGS